ncbi:hypothetical protein [Neptuniibacter sp. QD37_11]|uniref:hypothetical protein n=1 Tax=Neptuniibacter sp. QD37_11 TaxID=3398209 RepID=UPI0039F5ECA5
MNQLLLKAQEIADLLNEEDKKPAEPESGVEAWLTSNDVGNSSLFILKNLRPEALNKHPDEVRYAHPHDVGDFVRCLKLLAAEPSLVDDFWTMRNCSDV